MGTKRQLAPKVGTVVRTLKPGPVLDAFAGMCSVGVELSTDRQVWVNDVQRFAYEVGAALFTSKWGPINPVSVADAVHGEFLEHQNSLSKKLSRALSAESEVLCAATFQEFEQARRRLTRMLAIERSGLRRTPYRLFTESYADTFFGVAQAVEIDSLVAAIQRVLRVGKLNDEAVRWCNVAIGSVMLRLAFQHLCIPLAQHISSLLLEKEMAGMSKPLKVHFRTAHDTYVGNEGQGLQQAGQILEAVVDSIVKQAIKDGTIPAATAAKALADQIDALYATGKFTPHRAALGGAREFVKNFRNIASHPAPSGKQAAEKIRKCRSGFLDAIRHTNQLRQAATSVGYRLAVIL